MSQNPIYFIDDDPEEMEMIQEAAKELGIERPILYFENGDKAIERLKSDPVSPFIIICDFNLPTFNGFEIKKRIEENPGIKYKGIPFVFWSSHASGVQIEHAYDLAVQGLFFKSPNFSELCKTLAIIIAYWENSKHPKKML